MNVVNRVIVVVVLVVLIVLLPVTIFFVMAMPDATSAAVGQAAESVRASLSVVNRVIFSVLAVCAFVAAVLLLWTEIRRSRAKVVALQDVKVGEARVSIDSIVQRLEYNIDRLQDVVSAKPSVKPKANGIDVLVLLQTTPEIDVPMKTEEVMQLTREVVESQMGLKLHKVSVEIKHAPYSEDTAL
jgi:hypothetical protein